VFGKQSMVKRLGRTVRVSLVEVSPILARVALKAVVAQVYHASPAEEAAMNALITALLAPRSIKMLNPVATPPKGGLSI
jgi:hypothetical protein